MPMAPVLNLCLWATVKLLYIYAIEGQSKKTGVIMILCNIARKQHKLKASEMDSGGHREQFRIP